MSSYFLVSSLNVWLLHCLPLGPFIPSLYVQFRRCFLFQLSVSPCGDALLSPQVSQTMRVSVETNISTCLLDSHLHAFHFKYSQHPWPSPSVVTHTGRLKWACWKLMNSLRLCKHLLVDGCLSATNRWSCLLLSPVTNNMQSLWKILNRRYYLNSQCHLTYRESIKLLQGLDSFSLKDQRANMLDFGAR